MRPPRREAELQEAEYICRLGELGAGGDYWWLGGAPPARSVADTLAMLQAQIAPMGMSEAREIVQPSVADAVTQKKRHGLPYLEDWLKSRGGSA